jgi:hypothetical protein
MSLPIRLAGEDPPGTPAEGGGLVRLPPPKVPDVPAGDATTTAGGDEQRSMLTVALAGIARETAIADTYYLRGRTLLALVATLFVAGQAAFIALIGRADPNNPKVALLTLHERQVVVWVAAGAGLALAVAALVLIFFLDRPRGVNVVGAQDLDDRINESGYTGATGWLVDQLLAEQEEWAASNKGRKRATFWFSLVAAACAVVSISQFVLIYQYLT